ncbi:MAG: DUF6320 domain-containing protein [Lachnospiraceae bacterium]|nr:DUF6320 domain-containing protein [Lachnospiraceae bacterium]
MNRCQRCKVDIIDDTVKCPLCHGVLVHDENSVQHQPLYPTISQKGQALQWLFKITIFASIIAEAVCILVNYLTTWQVKWSFVTGIGLAYACFTILYSVKRNKSHQRKMVMQLIIGLFVIFVIDLALGYKGWSVAYAIPSAIMSMDIGFGVLMIVNRKNWQIYIMPQIWMVIASAACLILAWMEMDVLPLFALIAIVVSVIALAVSIVFGDRRAGNELYRRFHI